MILNNLKIVTPNKIIDKGYIEIENGIIKNIGDKSYAGNDITIDKKGLIAMPGFIDLHVHGNNNIDFMDFDNDDLINVEASFYKEGVTSYLLTTLSSSHNKLKEICEKIANIKSKTNALLGIHLEGPYINEKYRGAQNEKYIRKPNILELEEYINLSNNNIKYITLAPELDGAIDFIKYSKKNNIIISVGHSDANNNNMFDAINCGLSNVTHINNAMKKYGNIDSFIIDSAIENNLYCEFICDLVHINKETLKGLYNKIGPKRLIMISDALKVKNTNICEFLMEGIPAIKKEDAAYLKNGKLAGSILTIDKALRNINELVDATLIDLSLMSSTNAANSLNLFNIGRIEENKTADIVLLDKNLNVIETYKNGIKVY